MSNNQFWYLLLPLSARQHVEAVGLDMAMVESNEHVLQMNVSDPQRDHAIFVRNIITILHRLHYETVAQRRSSSKRGLEHVVPEEKEWVPSDTECPVCLSGRPRLFEKTACGHMFCKKCTQSHFSKHHQCPLCRADVDNVTLVHRMAKQKM